MKYITFVPLISGMAIANANVVGKKPEFVLSYKVFEKNESNLKNYWPDVKWYLLNPDTNEIEGEQPDFTDINFVSSVCPCAGMSSLSRTSNPDSAVNDWLYKVAEYTLEKIKPKVYWGENAPGLYSKQNEKVLNRLIQIGKDNGYAFTIYRTNTLLHGVPQHRQRTFFFFWKGDKCPWMEQYRETPVSFEKYIKGNEGCTQNTQVMPLKPNEYFPEMRWIMEIRCNGTYEGYRKFMFSKKAGATEKTELMTPLMYINRNNLWKEFLEWLDKDSYRDRHIRSNGSKTFYELYTSIYDKVKKGGNYWASEPLLYRDRTNAIIGKNMQYILHPTEYRFLTIRELMSMMGLPKDFELTSGVLNHIGQNVPVKTAEDMTRQVMKFIEGDLEMSPFSVIKHDNTKQKIDKTEI